jgi:hypothetical protein
VGARVSPAGMVLAPSGFVIGPGGADAALAFDGTNYLVVWPRFVTSPHSPFGGYDLFGARVTPAGVVLDSPPLTVFAAFGEQVSASITFDGDNYFVVWRDSRPDGIPQSSTDIYGSRITPEGVNLDPLGIAVSTAARYQQWPHVVFAAGRYFVTWSDSRNDSAPSQPRADIYAARMSPEGALLDGPPDTGGIPVNTVNAPGKGTPRAAFDGRDYFVVWRVGDYFSGGIRAARVSTEGELLDGPRGHLLADAPCFPCRLVYPNVHWNGERRLLVSWINNSELGGVAKSIEGTVITRQRR